MKKILSVVLAAMMLISMASFSASAEDAITVTLDGAAIEFADQAPTIVEGRTLVPLRAIFEALGASVEWNGETRTVTSAKGDTAIELSIDSTSLYVNGEVKTLDVPAMIINGRTMVPARAIAEAYGVEVAWDGETRTVILTTPVVEEAGPELAEGTILYLTGENYKSDIEGLTYENNVGIAVVDNPDREGDKVLYFETNVTEKQAWNYLWYKCEWVPGQRYLITFSARPGNDAFGNPVVTGSFGINVRTNGADKGVDSILSDGGVWKNNAYIYTIPEDIDLTKDMKFGIFASPIQVDGYDHNLAWSFYLDNISVVPYYGEEEDGRKDAAYFMGATGAGVPSGFDIDTAKGEVIDLSVLTSSSAAYEDGQLHFVAEGEMTDPLVLMDNLNYDASKYAAIAVEFKKVSGDKAYSSQIFFATTVNSKLDEEKSLTVDYSDSVASDDGYIVSYFDFADNEKTASNWNSSISMLRFDPGNGNGEWFVKTIKLIEK